MQDKIQLIKDYLINRSEILMAFVFGSYAKNQQTPHSDFDIGVYFKSKGRAIEWEETIYYDAENEIWHEIEKIVGLETDFVVLNRAPATVAFSIIEEGIPIVIKDEAFYTRYYKLISSAAEYLREFAKDFSVIKERSTSLSDIDRDRLVRIIDFLENELGDYVQFANVTEIDYHSDSALRRNLERWVENVVNSSIDIAKILLASERRRIPQTYKQIMENLSLIKNFDHQTAHILSKYSKLRNIIAHEYLDVRFDQIKMFVEETETYYKRLIDFVKNHIKH